MPLKPGDHILLCSASLLPSLDPHHPTAPPSHFLLGSPKPCPSHAGHPQPVQAPALPLGCPPGSRRLLQASGTLLGRVGRHGIPGPLSTAHGVGTCHHLRESGVLILLPVRPRSPDQLPLRSGGWDLVAKDSGRGTQVRVEAPQDLPLRHLQAGPREPRPGWVGLTALSRHRAPSQVHRCLLAQLGKEGAHPTAWSFPVWGQRPEHPWVLPAALAELDRPGPYGSTHLIP